MTLTTILLPIIGAILCIFVGNPQSVKSFGLAVSIVVFWMTLVLYNTFDNSVTGYQLITYGIALDGISMPFVLLTGFLTPITILASWYNINKHVAGFIAGQLLIEGLLMLVWIVTDLFTFYMAFEAVLIPLFVTVGIWGTSTTRIRSSFLLFMYTLMGSLFMLLSLVLIYTNIGLGSFEVISQLDLSTQTWVWIGMFIAFATKTPIMPFHMWLPRAHADAPLAASMVLAGTVLKMATYGYLRMCIQLMPTITGYYAPMVQSLAILSLVYASFATIRQSDMKALIAYSSIGHIAVVIIGIFSNNMLGIIGGIILGLAHGVVSPALFVLTGGILYDRYHTRCYYYYRGLSAYIPLFSVLFFLAICCNIGVPLTANWLGEFVTLVGTYQCSPFITVMTSTGIILSAIYSVWIFVRIVGGSYSPYLSFTGDITRREYYVLLYLLAPAIVFGVYADPIIASMSTTVSALLY